MTVHTPQARPRDGRLGRRGFLAQAAGSLTLAFCMPEFSRLGQMDAASSQANAWLRIGADDSVTLTIGASEMGQGSFSGLAQILAEDLMVDYAKIKTVQAPPIVSLAPGQPLPIGYAINTVGSSVTRTNYWKMRDAAAAAREMLVEAAMNRVGNKVRANYTVAGGVVTYAPTKAKFTYGQLAAAAALLQPPAAPPLVPDNQFRVIGKTVPRLDIPSKVDGSAIYGIDVRLPGMLYAIVKHCPTFGGTLAATPSAPNGMTVAPLSVAPATGRGTEVAGAVNAVAVVGSNTWDAMQAARKLRVSWKIPAEATGWDDARFLADAQALATKATPYAAGGANPPGTLYTVEGDAAAADARIASSARKLDVAYTLPYVAHACMEVLNCTASVVFQNGVPQSCEIYAPTQNAKAVLTVAMAITGLSGDRITVHTTYLGGGLGRKAEVDYVSQAVQVAMTVKKPVKLMWPREQDFTRDQYRPMALVRARAGLDNGGNITAWAYRNVSPSILGQRGVPLGPTGDSQGIEGANALPYNFGVRLTEWVSHPSPIPVGFWRSVGASINTFAVESFIDELALAAGQDSYTFRRSKLTDPRWIAVLDAAANLGNWHSSAAAGHARGIAIGTAFGSIVAEVVEISNVTATSLRINRVACAIDCYLPVNPGSIQAQLQGGIVHGINAALYGQQVFVDGAAQNANFNRSRMIRRGEMPQVDIAIIPGPSAADRTAAIGGVGELGVPTLAPALANAYAKLTGKRVRSLPFFPGSRMGD